MLAGLHGSLQAIAAVHAGPANARILKDARQLVAVRNAPGVDSRPLRGKAHALFGLSLRGYPDIADGAVCHLEALLAVSLTDRPILS